MAGPWPSTDPPQVSTTLRDSAGNILPFSATAKDVFTNPAVYITGADALTVSSLNGFTDGTATIRALASGLVVMQSDLAGFRAREPAIFPVVNNVNIAAEATIYTPTAGKRFRLLGWLLVQSVAGIITLRDNTAGTIIARIPAIAGGAGDFVRLGGIGIKSAAVNNVLTATGAAASVADGTLLVTEES